MSEHDFDYIIVGAGAGGGPLAANLAKAGYRVCVMEAGRRPAKDLANTNVPAFHPFATEDPHLGWYHYVRHFENDAVQSKDHKYQKSGVPDLQAPDNGDEGPPYRYPKWQPKDGVFYPRASAVGGCTTHHAHITVYPRNSDWDYIVKKTGDWTWNPENMRRYFTELERCTYRPFAKFFANVFGINPTRHGFNGWLPTKIANVKLLKRDKQLTKLLLDSALVAHENVAANPLRRLFRTLIFKADYNAWGLVKREAEGIRLPALSVNENQYRSAAREYLEEVEAKFANNLTIKTGVLVEKVLFKDKKDDDGNWIADGVQYYEGYDLYEASASYDPEFKLPEARELRVNREVILAGGAFSTPQILMLSGIGDREYLNDLSTKKPNSRFKNGPQVRVHLPGVGRNLQDRYEVGLVQTLKKNFKLLEGATLTDDPNDPHFQDWLDGRDGTYATNGVLLAIIKRSTSREAHPDLYIFGAIGPFRGYEPGYSAEARETRRAFTWVVLKADPNMRGCVELNREDPFNPRRLPYINFKYFNDSEHAEDDLKALREGVKLVRAMTKEAEELIEHEAYPGIDLVPTSDEQAMSKWIEENAWGHHASCTCPMGLRSHSEQDHEGKQGYLAVLDSKFRVFGTSKLRVVDASVFPKIPGFFIALPIFMVSQKASEQIINDARNEDRLRETLND